MLECGPAMSSSGNTRPREHDANPNPRFPASGFFARWRKNARIRSNCAQKMAKTDGANSSVASLDVWLCNVPFWEHQSSALRACSVPLREHQASGARCESEPAVSRLGSSSFAGGNS